MNNFEKNLANFLLEMCAKEGHKEKAKKATPKKATPKKVPYVRAIDKRRREPEISQLSKKEQWRLDLGYDYP